MSEALRVVWQSDPGAQTGLSIHSRQLVLHLDLSGVYMMHRGAGSGEGEPLQDEVLAEIDRRPIQEDAFQISYLPADRFYHGHRGYKIGFTMLEVDGLPDEWVKSCNAMDEIFVPSHFNLQTFRESGVRRPITVIPLGCDTKVFNPQQRAHRIEGFYTFISLFEWGERKAPEILFRAFSQEFWREEPVLLLVKAINHDRAVDVRDEIAGFDLSSKGGRIFVSLNQFLPPSQLASLLCSSDCFVLPTRGEGWGMPILEAMACGLPVIATNWGGQTEFMNEANAYPLRIKEVVPAEAKCPYYKGFHWAEPDLEHLRYLLRYVYEHQEEAKAKGLRASQEVRKRWSWERAAERIKSRLSEIEPAQLHGSDKK